MPNYVAGFLFSHDRKRVALVQKAKPEWQRGRLNAVGGKIEEGETPAQAMVREFKEEAGLDTAEVDWKHCVTLSFDGGKIYFYRLVLPPSSTHANGETELQEGIPEVRAVEPIDWWYTNLLPDHVIPNLKWLVPLCLDTDLVTPIEIEDASTPATGASSKAAARVGPTVGALPAVKRPAYRYQITVREVIDGDTLKVDVALGFHTVVTTNLRLLGVNCPELITPAGLAARDFTRQAIDDCSRVLIADTVKPDKYGDRWGATVWLSDSLSLNDHLVAHGHAVRTGPGGGKV